MVSTARILSCHLSQWCLHSKETTGSFSLILFSLTLWLCSQLFKAVWALPSYQFYQLPRDSVHTAIISGFQTIGDRNQSAALLCFPLTPLSSPWRGFCCCISAFFLCTQEAREQTSECFDSCFPSPETNIETQHRHRRYLMKQRRCC